MFLLALNTPQGRCDIKGQGRFWQVRKHTYWRKTSSSSSTLPSSHQSTINIAAPHPAGDRASCSSWICLREHAIGIPAFLSEHPSHNLILGCVLFMLTNCSLGRTTTSSGCQKQHLAWNWKKKERKRNHLHLFSAVTRGKKKFHCRWFFRAMQPPYQGDRW